MSKENPVIQKNMSIYDELKTVPKDMLKPITGGRLKGMSDIKPQWRIERLTAMFGACGIGWKVSEVKYHYFTEGNETVVNCRMKFQYKWEGEWSESIPVSGGAKVASWETKTDYNTQEKSQVLYISDEAEKMAYTDALSVAGKMIGLASDIYMGLGGSKYELPQETAPAKVQKSKPVMKMDSKEFNQMISLTSKYTQEELLRLAKAKYEISEEIEEAILFAYEDLEVIQVEEEGDMSVNSHLAHSTPVVDDYQEIHFDEIKA